MRHSLTYVVLLPIFACASFVMGASAYAPEPGPHIDVHPELQASFLCAKAKSIDDRIICSDPSLARLDRRLAEIYILTRGALSGSERAALLQTQRDWLAGHDQACGISPENELPTNTVECVTNRYHARIGYLVGLLSRGNVIRELAGTEPWAENTERYNMSANRVVLMQACVGDELAEEVNSCCAPGTETVEETESTTSTYAINGKRYLLFNGKYRQFFNVPRGACTTEINDKGEEIVDCPQVTPTLGSCAALFAETEPGKGEYVYAGHRWNSTTTLADLLVGSAKDVIAKPVFASELHSKILTADAITLVDKNGKMRHYRWDAGKNMYVE